MDWIRTEDALPPDKSVSANDYESAEVLIYTDHGEIEIARYNLAPVTEKMRWSVWPDMWPHRSPSVVTHWMPLPEPPEDE